MKNLAVLVAALGVFLAPPSHSADDIGIFETLLESSLSFIETDAALAAALEKSSFQLHASHVVRVPEAAHQAKVYVLTSPAYSKAAANEPARTVSAQILRVAVFTTGDEQTTFVNMANPVAHAMVYYADSSNYDALVAAARDAAEQIRQAVAKVPGTALGVQAEPMRSEKHYRKFKGDGPARMMAKFRRWKKSQLQIMKRPAEDFDAVVESVVSRLREGTVADASETTGWNIVSQVRLRDDVVHIGLSNPYIEDKMIRINSRFRKDGKSDLSPFPGVDHVAALPTEVLVVRENGKTLVLHYGQMWRMQLYFWDSGYRAFTANVGVPDNIVDSIEGTIESDQ